MANIYLINGMIALTGKMILLLLLCCCVVVVDGSINQSKMAALIVMNDGANAFTIINNKINVSMESFKSTITNNQNELIFMVSYLLPSCIKWKASLISSSFILWVINSSIFTPPLRYC